MNATFPKEKPEMDRLRLVLHSPVVMMTPRGIGMFTRLAISPHEGRTMRFVEMHLDGVDCNGMRTEDAVVHTLHLGFFSGR